MNQTIQSVNHSLIPSVGLPTCLPSLLAISQLLPAWPNSHQLEERKEPSILPAHNCHGNSTVPYDTVPYRTVLLHF